MDEGRARTWTSRAARSRREAGLAAVELVGLAAAVALLVGAVALGLRGNGDAIGSAVQARLQQSVTEPSPAPSRTMRARRAMTSLGSGRWRNWQERRWSGGQDKVHVPRGELRSAPGLQDRALWQREVLRRDARGAARGQASVRACVLCTALEWSRDARRGAVAGTSGRFLGGEGSILGEARLALAAADAQARGSYAKGPLTLDARGRVRAQLGAEARVRTTARLSREVQALELEAGAMAGASAKAEGRVGAALLGVAVEQAGELEAWAGVGVRATGALRRDAGRLSWRIGWGAALGIGGAGEWSGSVDVSRLTGRR